MSDLKPCPFCGGEANVFPNFTAKDCYVVECDDCKADSAYCTTEEAAIAAWNRRSDSWAVAVERCAQEAIKYSQRGQSKPDKIRAAQEIAERIRSLTPPILPNQR